MRSARCKSSIHLNATHAARATGILKAIPRLKALPSLRVLNLTGAKVSAAGAAEIQRALPECIVFHESLE